MTAILSNLAKTLTPKKLLDSIRRLDPELGQRLQGALSAGFTVDQIMKILDKPQNQRKFKDKVAMSQVESANPLVEAESIRKGARAEDLATKGGKIAKQAGKGAALAAGYLATRGLSSLFDMPNDRRQVFAHPDEILPALQQQRQLPGPQARRGLPAPGPQAQAQPTGTPGTPPPQPAPPAGQGTPQTPGPFTPPQAPRAPNPAHAGIIGQLGNAKGVIDSIAGKESPQVIADLLEQKILSPGQKKWLSEQSKEPLANIIEDYLAEQPKESIGYHQTTEEAAKNILESGFKSDISKSGIDPVFPQGVFLKPSEKDIGLEGKKQIKAEYSPGKNISFKNRKELENFLKKDEKYSKLLEDAERLTNQQDNLSEKIVSDDTGILGLNILRKNGYSEDKINTLIKKGSKNYPHEYSDEEAIKVIENQANEKRKEARDKSTEIFKNLGYDSIYVKDDFGTETFLVLDPKKVKAIREKKEKPTETNLVLTPSGDIGSLSKEEKGVASVDVDGKQRNFREQDVIKAPIPEKDIADIYEDLINAIPQNERSAVINVAGYDPDQKELVIVYHSGDVYTFSDIPEEFAEKIKDAGFEAKTTGKNVYRAWTEGKPSRNAGMSKLIKEIEAKYGKGSAHSRKYKNVFDFLAIPKAAVKEKEKRKREEERARQGKKARKPRSS